MKQTQASPRNIYKHWFRAILVLLVGIVALLLVRAWRVAPVQYPPVIPHKLSTTAELDAQAKRLAAALRIRTVAGQDDAFSAFHTHLKASFPLVHSRLNVEHIARHTLLYTLPGQDTTKAPVVLMAHQDVVDAGDGWQHDPFSGHMDAEIVWGRGAIDDKSSLMAILEATESLLREGIQPSRTILLAFGDDEETSGAGARAIVKALETRNIKPFFVLDEGLAVTRRLVPGVQAPVALIGVAEKGIATFRITTSGTGGHASMPPKDTAVTRLASVLARLTDNPMPTSLDGPAGLLFDGIAPHAKFGLRVVFANRDVLAPLLLSVLTSSPSSNALVRTTCVATMLDGSDASNVLPTEAHARVNCRILPGDTVETVHKHLVNIVGSSGRVTMDGGMPSDPTPISKVEHPAFQHIARTIKTVFPEAVVAPGLVIAATDARAFAQVSDLVYRFMPLPLTPDNVDSIHGKNERLGIHDYQKAIQFYATLMSRL